MNIKTEKYLAGNYTDKESIYSVFKEESGLYVWWMPIEEAKKLNMPMDGCDVQDGLCKVYVGIAKKSMAERLYWHICELNDERLHAIGKIRSKTISTLRQSLCAILAVPMDDVSSLNRLIDAMQFQVLYVSSDEAERLEKATLFAGVDWYPLNMKGNKCPPLQAFVGPGEVLSKARKASRLKALGEI